MKKFLLKLELVTFCFISFLGYSQGISINKPDNVGNQNSLSLHLATTKLCKDFYANKDLNLERENRSNYKGPENQYRYTCHICAASIRYPFMSPLESFVDRYLNDKRLMRNKSNAFTVKTLRGEIKTKYEKDYYQMVDAIDTENLLFYQTDLIEGYSFDTNELYISMSNPRFSGLLPNTMNIGGIIFSPLLMGHGVKKDGNVVNMTGSNYLGSIKVPMSDTKAQEIYSNFANHYHPNPPFSIATKLHYALRLSKEYDGKPRYYQVVLKKIEFFLPSIENLKKMGYRVLKKNYTPEKKIAEVVFEENIYNTAKGYTYQNIKSIH